jgi:hypothetical protein
MALHFIDLHQVAQPAGVDLEREVHLGQGQILLAQEGIGGRRRPQIDKHIVQVSGAVAALHVITFSKAGPSSGKA